jgi:hypothetical protein
MSRTLCLPLALLVFSSLPCFGQQTAQQTASAGYTACPAGEGYVYLYRSPSDFTVLANLKCGTKLEILGSGNGYVAVRTADGKQGYVLLSAVTVAPPATPALESAFVSSPQPPARAASSSPLFGNFGRTEISAGYSYLSMDLSGLGNLPRGNGNGFQSSLTLNLNRWLGAEGTVDAYFKNNPLSTANFYDYTLMAGPRVSIRPFFVHALFGVDLLTASVSGSPTFSQSSVAGALGGGAQWRLRPLWSVYTSADYVVALHSLPGNPAATQNNVRVSAGIVFHIGGYGGRN